MDKKNPQLIQRGLKKPQLYSLGGLIKVERPLSASELPKDKLKVVRPVLTISKYSLNF